MERAVGFWVARTTMLGIVGERKLLFEFHLVEGMTCTGRPGVVRKVD
jgi:hypothetical protein